MSEQILIGAGRLWYAPTGEANPPQSTAYGATWGGNWRYLGNTLDQVSIAPSFARKEYREAGRGGPTRVHEVTTGITVQTTLAETTATIIREFAGGATGTILSDDIESQPIGARAVPTVYKWGLETIFTDNAGNQSPVRYFWHRGALRWAGDTAMARRSAAGIPVEIALLEDTSQAAGNEYGIAELPTVPHAAQLISTDSSFVPSGTDINVTGLSIADGDLVFIHVCTTDMGETTTPPSGFLPVSTANSGEASSKVYWKIAGSEPANYTITGTVSTQKGAVVTAWRGRGAKTPDVSGSKNDFTPPVDWAVVTPTVSPGTLFYFGFFDTDDTYSPDGAEAEIYQFSETGGVYFLMVAPYVGLTAPAVVSASRDGGGTTNAATNTTNAPIYQ